jgi:hypothetical protein
MTPYDAHGVARPRERESRLITTNRGRHEAAVATGGA